MNDVGYEDWKNSQKQQARAAQRCGNDCAMDPGGVTWHYPPCAKAKGDEDGRIEL